MDLVSKLASCFDKLYDEQIVALCEITEGQILCSAEYYAYNGKYDPVVFIDGQIPEEDEIVTSSEGQPWGDILFRMSDGKNYYVDLIAQATPQQVAAAITSVYMARIRSLKEQLENVKSG